MGRTTLWFLLLVPDTYSNKGKSMFFWGGLATCLVRAMLMSPLEPCPFHPAMLGSLDTAGDKPWVCIFKNLNQMEGVQPKAAIQSQLLYGCWGSSGVWDPRVVFFFCLEKLSEKFLFTESILLQTCLNYALLSQDEHLLKERLCQCTLQMNTPL